MGIKITAKLFTISFLTFTLMSCSSIGLKESPLWHMTASDDEKSEYFSSICAAHGFKYNTPAMSQCITLERRSSRKSSASDMAAGFRDVQNNMNNRFNNMPTTTNCQRWGSGINCTSY